MNYTHKYLKYKIKYLEYKKMIGGKLSCTCEIDGEEKKGNECNCKLEIKDIPGKEKKKEEKKGEENEEDIEIPKTLEKLPTDTDGITKYVDNYKKYEKYINFLNDRIRDKKDIKENNKLLNKAKKQVKKQLVTISRACKNKEIKVFCNDNHYNIKELKFKNI